MRPTKHDGLIANYDAGGAIAPHRIVAFGAVNYEAVQAAANTDPIAGASTDVAATTGDPVDVIHDGVVNLEYGGSVAIGDWLTADADGRAITAAPAAGANMQVVGRAVVNGVVGDIGSALIQLTQVQG